MPADPAASLAADLRTAADRARDERLRLAAIVRQQQHAVHVQGGPAPAEQIAALGEKINKLDQAVSKRLAAMTDAEARLDQRMSKLEDLRDSVTQASQAFAEQVQQAQHFKSHVDAAKQHVRMSAGQIVEDIRLHLGEFEGPIAERLAALNDLDDQIDKRIARMQQMHKQAGDAVDKHLLGALRQAKEQAATMVEPIKAELDTFLQQRAQAIETTVQNKIAALDVDVEDALRPVTERFDQIVAQAQDRAAELADALPGELDARCEKQIEQLRETLMQQVTTLMQGRDEKVIEQAAQQYREAVGNQLGDMFDQVEQEAELFSGKLSERFEDAREKAAARFGMVIDELEADYADRAGQLADHMAKRVVELTDRARQEVEAAAGEVDVNVTEAVDAIVTEIETTAGTRIDGMLATSSGKLKQLTHDVSRDIDAAFADAVKRIDALKSESSSQVEAMQQQAKTARSLIDTAEQDAEQITSRLQAITGCIDESADQAQHRLAELEATTGDRLDGVENAAKDRLAEIDDLIQQKLQMIDQSADPVSKHLAEQLTAFHQLSKEAREEAQQVIRDELAELHQASKAMAEVISRRLQRHIEAIQPEADAAMRQAELAISERMNQLRHNAQTMAELTRARIDQQINKKNDAA